MPLPASVLDLLLICNITLSVIVLVTMVYVQSPLEFAVFPSLLLAVTLFRLVLNVATTRLILTADGDPVTALHSAGEVINTFSEFVTRGSLAVGIIIFLIIFIIQFVVITKGSGRISEVAARFTLDAMPGKQMAIDADLNSGNITEPQARERRENDLPRGGFLSAPWTVPANSFAATPSPASSSPSSMSSAASTWAWSSSNWDLNAVPAALHQADDRRRPGEPVARRSSLRWPRA